mmetsp:Transcript_8058/g.14120  ORF Transcript_8058/g.14120 Transcript_8058/m.14120 type:complete len:82 (-) Transcript_8058:290-535(-)|eukprot:CAMPEP_0183779592 /NCGR_PEP_ID=MMETSP0739-20130205/54261_1 /TAXON_ID=385413 /ORGANISM="Thalassiosira miniscula, Strain CCMP1093" /LENGTH=81 /DNA_ID=CAMNT_0026022273 /DNA_START=99 /DNA_END=344 /DNA_ORIENTATION=-
MDRDYFQHVEEVSFSALRLASRAIAIMCYGGIGVYVLSVAFTGKLPTVMSDAMPQLIDEDPSLDMLANGSQGHEVFGYGEL